MNINPLNAGAVACCTLKVCNTQQSTVAQVLRNTLATADRAAEVPTLTAQRITRNGARLLIAVCPVCSAELIHGDSGSDYTHRRSHCQCWGGGYYLTTNEQEAQHDS